MANIVICADGTWNRPEEDPKKDVPTNVLKLARAIKPSDGGTRQHVFYDWGLGSYHDSTIAGATGRGIHKNIQDGYRYIVQNYDPGDQIYLFGFSRGAYTVRALCGLINNCGILKRPHADRIARAFKIYKSPAGPNKPKGQAAADFRQAYCHPSSQVHFVGVWDTVGALGIPVTFLGLFDGHDEFYNTKMGPNISTACHALAIDERRQDFEPTIWKPRPGVALKQVWFAGVHSDVGGSLQPDRGTGLRASDIPLKWMLDQAAHAGLVIEPHIRTGLKDSPDAKIHKSRKHVYRLKKPLNRPLEIEGIPTLIHPSVKTRYQADASYRPPMLKALVEKKGWNNMNVGE